MTLHRLTVPTYFGGLPAGYDLINDPTHPSVGGSGVAALADGQKSGGPNDGTYFVAFAEDGLSEVVNRPVTALAENTDFLDDILRTSIPTVTFTDATAAGAVSTINLTGQIYVGKNGASNNQAQRDRVVRITDQNNNDLEVSGSKIVATLVHDGASVNVIGTQVSGFRTNASVNVSPPIPDTTTYRVWYGVRNNYANVSLTDKGALFEEMLRVINNVSGEVRSLFRQVHSETSVNQAWDAAFDSTIRSLASAGLNERYRRATLQPAGFVSGDFNQAGSGAVIFLDGQAVTLVADHFLNTSVTWRDGNHALLKLLPETARSVSVSALSGNQGGNYAIWHESEWKAQGVGDPGMRWRQDSAGPALIEVIPYDMAAATFNGDTLLTYIDASSATATINPDSGSGLTARTTVECGPGQYFALTGPTRTAIRTGLDLLEVTDSNNKVRTFVIVDVLSATRVSVILPSGNSPLFSTTAEPGCKIRVIQTMVQIGGGLGRDGGGVDQPLVRPIIAIPPAVLTTAVANESVAPCSFFGAQTGSVNDATAGLRRARAVEFGATGNPDSGGTVDGGITPNAWINGDGSARLTKLTTTGNGSFGGTLSVSGAFSALAAATVTSTLSVGSTLTALGSLSVGANASVVGLTSTRAFKQDESERYLVFKEDWSRFRGFFAPNYLLTNDGYWDFNEITDTFTLNNGTSTAKNPGQLEVIGAGGSTTRELSIRKGSLPIAFANVEELTVIAKIDGGAGNVADSITVGLMDNPEQQVGGADAIALFFLRSASQWKLFHRVGGANGPQHNTTLASFTNNSFISMKLLKNGSGNLDIFINGSGTPTVTILAADIPTGFCTLGAYFIQTIGDADPATYVIDFMSSRAITSANRSGV